MPVCLKCILNIYKYTLLTKRLFLDYEMHGIESIYLVLDKNQIKKLNSNQLYKIDN